MAEILPHQQGARHLASLRAQGKTAEAARVEDSFKKAWAQADVTLAASRF